MWGRLIRTRRLENAERESRRRELRYLEYLRDDIFTKPDIARMYWHTRHPGDLQVLSSTAFADIAGELRPAERIVPPANHALAELIRDFLRGLSDDELAHLVRQLGVVFRSFGRSDLADQLDPLANERHLEE
ncbi:hypothetical protein FHR83_001736 [Actinoplanes campanulatus]|uniref:Uncharacterized protein n=1 Tax=Actinoplanes campanulatus TaxID=113559 RepID=A0A7W5ADI0_9ACTN|nr:hypothetical protein [Actinoplanes campanulatus]MBB3094087.1 hypothetical protein [Actinoplanes campanulatus]GGN32914.1 hypothetical protein GCM10010109_54400 [Actinoplanes campanulatus]GID38215.1 hypothetical protein Aca09nite_47210 [Actinoplanes campanulatus]